jgi:hypothetical protein
MFRHVSQSGQTPGNISEGHRETSNVSEFSRKQILFPQQCFHGWANRETFEETSRITNVSTTSKGRRFDSHCGRAYFSSSPGVDIHSRVTSQTSYSPEYITPTQKKKTKKKTPKNPTIY